MPDYDVIVIGSGFGGSVTALRLTERVTGSASWRPASVSPTTRCPRPRGTAATSSGRRSSASRAFSEFTCSTTDHSRRGRRRRRIPQLRQHPLRTRCNRSTTTRSGRTSPIGTTNWPRTTRRRRRCSRRDQSDDDQVRRRDAQARDAVRQGDTFHATPVGVFFGRDGAKEPGVEVPDPFFGGVGPSRRGCLECGSCMTGCRHNAKNTLVKNYLALASGAARRSIP